MFDVAQCAVPLSYHNQRKLLTTSGNHWRSLTVCLVSNAAWVRMQWLEAFTPSRAMTKQTIAPASNLRWLKTSEVCERLGVSYQTWAKWRQRGCAPRASRLPNGELRTREDWLHEFMNGLEV